MRGDFYEHLERCVKNDCVVLKLVFRHGPRFSSKNSTHKWKERPPDETAQTRRMITSFNEFQKLPASSLQIIFPLETRISAPCSTLIHSLLPAPRLVG